MYNTFVCVSLSDRPGHLRGVARPGGVYAPSAYILGSLGVCCHVHELLVGMDGMGDFLVFPSSSLCCFATYLMIFPWT